MNLIRSSQRLREGTRLLLRKLGIFERDEALCCGVTYAQCHAVVEVGRKETLSLNELAELLNLDKSTVSKTVDQLVKNDIMLREPGQKDRRYVTLTLTTEGYELFQSIEKRMEAYFTEILDSIPENKREQVIEGVQILSDAMQKTECWCRERK
ncbi:MAG: transcriptional regulator, MarR family [Firmicutes bacterium]|nr:transcriptional regulator, MarR family [Bacillota bacterium]